MPLKMTTSSPNKVNESLLTCSFSIALLGLSIISHFFLAVFYWWRTGTFPFKEKVIKEQVRLRKERSERKRHLSDDTHELTE